MSNEDMPIKRKKRKKKKSYGFVYLFAVVFVGALYLITNLINLYSPNIDVTIGENPDLTLTDSDMDVEIKSVDERLKWIQMEDDMPTVSVKASELNNTDEIKDFDDINVSESDSNKDKKQENKIISSPPKPTMTEIKNDKDLRKETSSNKAVVPLPSPSVTKVYLGKFSGIEEAMNIQNKISNENSSIMPFVKASDGGYIVQLGSFSDPQKAQALIDELTSKGYSPKKLIEN